MATLEEKYNAEREHLKRLCDSMDKNAHDIQSLTKVLSACKSFSGLDPLPHIKSAMRHYLEQAGIV